IYYPNRDGLEDRVFRIKTERSGASTPEPRTSHNVTNVEVLAHRGDEVDVRYNFHTLNHRYKVTDHFFGTMFATLRKDDDALLIARKKIVLKNDYIRQVIDVYHV
ncbi:aromatic-ring-hydroxylating dioxygenase subunit beta, partial [Rhizobium ecuadorense]